MVLWFNVLGLRSGPGPYKVWHTDIEKDTLENPHWRHIVDTSGNMQMSLMSVPVGQELGWEVHPENDQFFRFEQGKGEVQTSKSPKHEKFESFPVKDGSGVIVPHGFYHNVVNTGDNELKLYTIYAPPHHPPDTIDKTHQDEIKRMHEE